MRIVTTSTLAFFLLLALAHAANQPPDGWQTVAPRDEIRPAFSFEPKGGPKNAGSLVDHARPSRRIGRVVSEVVRGERRRVLPLSRGPQDAQRRRAAPQRAGARALAG